MRAAVTELLRVSNFRPLVPLSLSRSCTLSLGLVRLPATRERAVFGRDLDTDTDVCLGEYCG